MTCMGTFQVQDLLPYLALLLQCEESFIHAIHAEWLDSTPILSPHSDTHPPILMQTARRSRAHNLAHSIDQIKRNKVTQVKHAGTCSAKATKSCSWGDRTVQIVIIIVKSLMQSWKLRSSTKYASGCRHHPFVLTFWDAPLLSPFLSPSRSTHQLQLIAITVI